MSITSVEYSSYALSRMLQSGSSILPVSAKAARWKCTSRTIVPWRNAVVRLGRTGVLRVEL